MEYAIISNFSIENMEDALVELKCDINEYISRGWKPIGDISMFEYDNKFYATQAMIKEDEKYEHKRQICNQRAVSVH